MERDEFASRLGKLMSERSIHIQFNMLISLIDALGDTLLSLEEVALGHSFAFEHSFRDSFNIINTNESGLFMKLSLRGSNREFIGEVIVLLMTLGKVKTLKRLYEKAPYMFKETNMDRLLKEITDGEGRFKYWEHSLCFLTIGKELK